MADVVLVAGASGSGKSRLSRMSGGTRFRLDDFYRDGDAPGLPQSTYGTDWDHPGSWDGEAALASLVELVTTGETTTPVYDIATSRRVGTQTVRLGRLPVVAEGIFAVELLRPAQQAGLDARGIWLARPMVVSFVLRAVRDLRGGRKPLGFLVRRWVALARAEPAMRKRHLGAGFEAYGFRRSLELIQASFSG